METYTGFAGVYDKFMDNVPYERWCGEICAKLRNCGIYDGLVLDLGCGTGRMTRLLKEQGYDMIGVDVSAEMLEAAMESDSEGILYLQQDMRELELYGTVAAAVCVCDCLNYLLEREELVKVFSLVNNYLDPGGIFLFDMNTPYKYREVIGDAVICENREHESFIWENYFDEETSVNEYALTLFVEQESGLFARCEEFHYQRAYDTADVIAALGEAGMEFLEARDEATGEPPGADCERICFAARERGKERTSDGT